MGRKHSVLLKEDKCEGCTNCVKNCPTKAIRVHQGKAQIIEELCIDCAECIRTCAYHAKYTKTDQLEEIKQSAYPVALIPPSFYGQFSREIKPIEITTALLRIGFKKVYDVAQAAEAVSQRTFTFLQQNKGYYISSSCPVVVRLIKKLYPELLSYLMPLKSPVELMAQFARNEFKQKKQETEIEEPAVFFLTPCPAKLTTVNNPLGMERSFLSGAIAVELIYPEILKTIKGLKKEIDVKGYQQRLKEYQPPYLGISWGQSGGEADILNKLSHEGILSAAGIHNVKALLEEISRDNITGVKYFELVACEQGCVGGVLNVNNPFQAKYNLKQLVRQQPKSLPERDLSPFEFKLPRDFQADEVNSLDENLAKAMVKLKQLEQEIEILPGLDCAACGAPDCETLAEDIVNGLAKRTDCIFVLRKQVGDLADQMSRLAHALPPVMKKGQENKKEQ